MSARGPDSAPYGPAAFWRAQPPPPQPLLPATPTVIANAATMSLTFTIANAAGEQLLQLPTCMCLRSALQASDRRDRAFSNLIAAVLQAAGLAGVVKTVRCTTPDSRARAMARARGGRIHPGRGALQLTG